VHHAKKVRVFLEGHGISYLFVPPYSPEFNPIEEALSENKAEPTGDGGMFPVPPRSRRHRAGFRREPARCHEVA